MFLLQTNGLKPALGQTTRPGTATTSETTTTTTTPVTNAIEKPPTETKKATNDDITKSSAVTPRIQDVVTPRIQDATPTEETKKNDANKENTNLEPGKRERTVVSDTEAVVGRKELRKEEKEEDSKEEVGKNERKDEAVKEGVANEEKSSDNEVGWCTYEGVTVTPGLLAVVFLTHKQLLSLSVCCGFCDCVM